MDKALPVGKDFSASTGAPYVENYTVERVTDPDVLVNEWEPLLHAIFPDENDWESQEQLLERLENGEAFFLMRDPDGKAVGFELSQILPNSGAMYIPWTGVLPEYRNRGVGADMNRTIGQYMGETYGVTHTLIDIEDPARMDDAGYDPSELDEAKALAQRRINFWRREGFVVVDDEHSPTGQKLEYARPSSENEQEIQAYDHMAIRLNNDSPYASHIYNQDHTAISKNFVRQCYLDMTRIQYDPNAEMDEAQLRAEYPAVEQYLAALDEVEGDWLPIHDSPIKPKFTPKVATSMEMINLGEEPAPDQSYEHDEHGLDQPA